MILLGLLSKIQDGCQCFGSMSMDWLGEKMAMGWGGLRNGQPMKESNEVFFSSRGGGASRLCFGG